MITLLTGENSFEVNQEIKKLEGDFNGEISKIDGSSITLSQLPDLLMGVSLFASSRMVIIRNLGENKEIWPIFSNWVDKISDDVELILVESKPDKRTTTFKTLKKSTTIINCDEWTDRDIYKAEKWTKDELSKRNIKLNQSTIRHLVNRVGVNQWLLWHAIEKISLTDDHSIGNLDNIIEPNLFENVFELFETAVNGDVSRLRHILGVLIQTQNVHRLFGLLSTQAFQLAAVSSASISDNIPKDFAIHPYVVKKLNIVTDRIGKVRVSKIINIFAETDYALKTSKAEAWSLVEIGLIKVASL